MSLTDGLHGVSLLDEQLSSGDVDVHAQGLLLLVHRVWCTSVFTGKVRTAEMSPWTRTPKHLPRIQPGSYLPHQHLRQALGVCKHQRTWLDIKK